MTDSSLTWCFIIFIHHILDLPALDGWCGDYQDGRVYLFRMGVMNNKHPTLGGFGYLWSGGVQSEVGVKWGDGGRPGHPSDLHMEVSIRSENLYWKTKQWLIWWGFQIKELVTDIHKSLQITAMAFAIQGGEVILFIIRWCQLISICTKQEFNMYSVDVLTFWILNRDMPLVFTTVVVT